jgi:L-rhamnose mutarotase
MPKRGIRTFSIFMDGNDLFLYAEVDLEQESSADVDTVQNRWQEFMSEILLREVDPATGRPPLMEEVFHFE